MDSLAISINRKAELLQLASDALLQYVGPSYQDLIVCAVRLEAMATTDDGVWKLPDGDKYYALALGQTTTTTLTADEIHQLGLSEVNRIYEEMKSIMRQVGFTGSLQEFFSSMATDPRFFYPNTDEGSAKLSD